MRHIVTSALTTPRLADPQASRQAAPAHVMNAVRQASASTGVDFSYLMEKASVESGYRTDVQAKTSSATGLFQFTEGTWLKMVKQYGSKHGLGVYADALETGENGRIQAKDAATRKEILNLRKDPRLSAIMAGELANENKDYLEGELGRPVGKTELYMAHFLGAGGAAKFLKALEKNPNQPAASLLPDAARANLNVFYDGSRPRSVGQVYDRFAAKFGDDAHYADSSIFGRVQGVDTGSQPWQYGRSVASGREPISTYAVMVLDSLAPPTSGSGSDPQRAGRKSENDNTNNPRITPNLAGMVGA